MNTRKKTNNYFFISRKARACVKENSGSISGGDNVVRVAHVIGKLNVAGVEAVINNYYRNIDHSKYQFDFFIDADGKGKPKEEIIDMGANYYVIPPYQKLYPHMSALIKVFRNNKYQIVHSSMNTLAPLSLFCAWKAGVPIRINHNHSTAGKGETKKNILKYSLRPFARCFANHYAACSKYAGEWLFGKHLVEKEKVTIFNNAIDVDEFVFDSSIRNSVRKDFGIENNYVIGHVGRFFYQKNHEFLIDIFEEISRIDDTAILLLVGIGELKDIIEEKVKDAGLEKKVLFLGARDDVNHLYQAMDAFVLPSHYEGLPVVGVEAQASGLPCFFSDQMTSETVILDETKVLSLSENAYAWAKKIVEAKNTVRKNRKLEMIQAGFDIKVESQKLEKYYDSLLSKL